MPGLEKARKGRWSTARQRAASQSWFNSRTHMSLEVGTRVGPYEIVSPLGRGGMGEVYRARDSRLGRFVAVKVLPAGVARDRERLARFEREARTASALNHPHIVNIYEIGDCEQGRYIAMELVEGRTLRAAAREKSSSQLVTALINVADALAAAHAAGIVHRDLKPENILVTADGYAKVLDFGLAKMTQPAASDPDAPTQEWMNTGEGIVVGTVGYMSPEQLQGREADHRSDIFSLGCVLYEVVAGRSPFAGPSAVDTMHRILHDEPPLISSRDPQLPDLQRVIRRCLAKNPDERYQSMKEVAIELRGIQRSSASGTAASPSEKSSAAVFMRQSFWWVAGVVIIAVAAPAAWRLVGRRSAASPAAFDMKRLTATGLARDAAISPDGKYVAYVVDEEGRQHIRLMQLATGSDLRIVEGNQTPLGNLTFSPDGQYLYHDRNVNDVHTLYRTAALGGEAQRIVVDCDSPPAFSPDGKRIAFLRYDPAAGESRIITANLDGGDEQVVVRRRTPISLTNPVWTADSEIVAIESNADGGQAVVAFDLRNGKERRIAEAKWSLIHDAAAAGKDHLLVAAEQDGGSRLWLVSLKDGEVQRITNDVNDYVTTSATASGDAIAVVQTRIAAGLSKVALDSADRPVEITPVAEARDGTFGVVWRADGGLAFASLRRGTPEIWAADAEGRNVRPMNGARGYFPCAFGRGSRVVFLSILPGGPLAVVDDESAARVLPIRGNTPACSPVDDAVIYATRKGLLRFQLSAPSRSQPVMGGFTIWPDFSPDGTRVAALRASDEGWVGTVAAVAGGPVQQYPAIGFDAAWPVGVHWTAGGNALLFKKKSGRAANVWMQPLDGSAASPVTHFTDGEIFDFRPSRDGRWLALSRGSISNDVVLITRR